MHYFVYCYAAFIIAFGLGGNSGGDACGRAAAVIAFVASWIIYVLSPFVYKRVKDLRKAFFFGHSLLVIVLAAAFFAPSMPVKIILYLLTGVGGTTEFCIGGLAKKWGLYSENAQGFAENTGHVLGVVFCLLLFVFLANLWISLLFAALFALAAIACMAKTIVTVDKEKI
jgi:hypothetical protein